MRIDVNTSKKYIDIWLAHGEEPPDVSEFHAHNKDYDIVIWRSGTGDLTALTAELLKNNLNVELPAPDTESNVQTGRAEQQPRQRKRSHEMSR